MCPKMRVLFFLPFITFALASCLRTSNEITAAVEPANVILNGSFEDRSGPSLSSWTRNLPDTSANIFFSSDAPADGGKTSIGLVNQWIGSGKIDQKIPVPEGINTIRLTVNGKAVATNRVFGASGTATCAFYASGEYVNSYSISFLDTIWTTKVISESIGLRQVDSIQVLLGGGIGQFNEGYILFDECKLELFE